MQALFSAIVAQMAVILLEKLVSRLAEALFGALQASSAAAAA
jgi:hypothetical protein